MTNVEQNTTEVKYKGARNASLKDALTATDSGREEVEAVKGSISFTALLKDNGIKVDKTGRHARCLCPFHNESTPSFTIYDDKTGHCFGCDWHGDVIAYVQEKQNCDFVTATNVLQLAIQTGAFASAPVPRSERQVSDQAAEAVWTEEDKRQARKMAQVLHESTRLYEQIAKSRGWKPETIASLAEAGFLGWHNQAIAFIYETGVKTRPMSWSKKEIRWMGKPHLWRASTIANSQEIYVAEGETDAISLIDSGVCTGATTIIALPSATTFKSEWASLFRGKAVTLCLDNDKPGKDAAEKLAALLAPVTKTIYTINLGEVAHVS